MSDLAFEVIADHGSGRDSACDSSSCVAGACVRAKGGDIDNHYVGSSAVLDVGSVAPAVGVGIHSLIVVEVAVEETSSNVSVECGDTFVALERTGND